MAETDIRFKEGVDRPIIEIANTMVGLELRPASGAIALTFTPADKDQVLKLHTMLADQINKGGVDLLFAPMVAHGAISTRGKG